MRLADKSDLKDKLVFVVNDDKTQLRILSVILQSEEMDVQVFDTADAAILALEQHQPDLIITDLNLPGIDGRQLCRLLRSSEFKRFNSTPILVVSATFTGQETARITLDSGASAFLPSPVKRTDLIEAVTSLLSEEKAKPQVKVLLIEDNDSHVKILRETFDLYDFSTKTTTNIAEARRLIQDDKFDVAIIDHHLPDGDGSDLLDEIISTQPDCVCLMMCSDPSPELAVKWLRSGAASYICEPFKPDYLIEMFTRVQRERNSLRVAKVLAQRTEELREKKSELESSHLIFTGILENTHVLVAFLDPQFNFIWVNSAYAEAENHEPEYFVGKNHFEIYPDEKNQQTFQQVVDTGEAYTVSAKPFRYPRQPERGLTYWDWSLVPIKDEFGKVTGLTLTLSETTEREKAIQSVKDSEQNFRSLFESMTDIIFVINPAGGILFTNSRASKVLGYTADEFIKMNVLQLHPPELAEKASKIFNEIVSEQRKDCPLPLVTKEGRELPVESRVWHGMWDGEKCIFGITKDLTQEIEAQHRFESLFQASPIPTALTDYDNKSFFEINDAFTKITGYSRKEVLGKTAGDLNIFIDQSRLEKIGEELREFGHSRNYELKIRRKNRKIIEGLFSGEVISLGEKRYLLTMMIDISDRKIVENAMKELLIRQQALLAAIPDIIMEVDQKYVYTWANQAGRDFFGEDAIGKEAKEYFIGEQETYAIVDPLFKGDENVIFVESWQRRQDGEKRLLAWWCRVLKDADGNAIGALSSARDITEAKRQEDELRLHSLVLDQIQDQVTITDLDGAITYVNRAEENKLGYTSDELIGKSTKVYGEDAEKGATQEEILHKTLSDGSWRGEVVNFAADGYELIMDCRTQVVYNEQNEPMALCGVSTDVTERKKVEQALRESEERFRSITEQTNDLIAVTNDEGIITYCSPSSKKIFHHTPEEMCGKPFMLFLDEASIPRALDGFQRTMESGASAKYLDLKMKRKDGSLFDGELSGSRFRCGGVDGSLVVIRDISDRIEANEKIRMSQQRLKLFIDASPDLHFLKDTDLRYVLVNNANAEFFGLSEAEIIGKTDEELMPAENAKGCRATDLKALSERKTVVSVEEVGGRVYETRKLPVFFDDEIVGIAGIIRDITEKQRAEELIIENEYKYRSLVENSLQGMVIALSDPLRLAYVSKPMEAISGYSRDELESFTAEDLIALIHPADRKQFFENFKARISHKEVNPRAEYRIITKDGTVRWVELFSTLIKHKNDFATQTLFIDITDRKLAEEALRESEEKFRHLFENAPVGVFRTNSKGKTLAINTTMAAILGFDSPQDAVNYYSDLANQLYLNPKRRDDFLRLLSENGVVENFEYEAITSDNRIVWLVMDARIKPGDTEDEFEIEGFASDITVRKNAIEALRASEETYRALLEGLPDIVMSFDRNGRHLFVSENIEPLTGIRASDYIGKKHRELGFPVELCASFERQIKTAFTTQKITESEFDYNGKQGTVTFNWRLIPEFNQFGEMVSVLSVSRDITAHRKLEQNYQQIFNEMLNGFAVHEIILDSTGKPCDYSFIAVNPAFERITGLLGEDVIGKTVREVLPKTEDHWIEMYGNVALTGEPAMFSNYSQDLDKYFEVASFRTGKNQFASVFSDFTERKKAEDALRESELKVRKKLQAVLDPEESYRDLELSDLVDIEKIQVLIDYLYEVTQFGVAILDMNGKILASTGWQDICMKFHRAHPETSQFCLESDLNLSSGVQPGEFKAYKCKNNMWDMVTPIIIGDEHVGNLFIGQFFYDDEVVDVEQFRTQARLYGFNEDEYLEALSKVPRWRRETVESIRSFYSKFVSFVSTLSFGNIKLARTLELHKRAEEEREQLREQLVQALKMESIGRLAGGVAHDLNNLLSPILGYSEMMLGDFSPDDSRRQSIDEIMQAGLRARNVVRQLLAFSRRQTLEYKTLDMNQIVLSFEKLLRHTIREDVKIVLDLSSDLSNVMADIGQIEQVIMNLAVNAQDAMPNGGTLTLETRDFELDENYTSRHAGIEPGNYVMLAISDTGSGMDEETRRSIFEPFFSTKGELGTGLGLSTVYGIIKQHGGSIWVYSELGKGTTFKIYLPATARDMGVARVSKKEPALRQGTETILIAEDNDQVRHLAISILKRQGYQVLSAVDGNDALKVFAEHAGRVHLLLTDVIMPDMNGKQLYERIAASHPDLKVLYMSGYTTNVIAHQGVLDEGIQFIQKPFTVRGLALKIRELLGSLES